MGQETAAEGTITILPERVVLRGGVLGFFEVFGFFLKFFFGFFGVFLGVF